MTEPNNLSAGDDNHAPGRLTSIRPPYTLAATPEAAEVDDLIIRHFLKTLAEVAVSVASRKSKEPRS